jgi:hypothetical protein
MRATHTYSISHLDCIRSIYCGREFTYPNSALADTTEKPFHSTRPFGASVWLYTFIVYSCPTRGADSSLPRNRENAVTALLSTVTACPVLARPPESLYESTSYFGGMYSLSGLSSSNSVDVIA